MPEIEVTIDENGNVKMEVKGAKSETCRKLTQELEKGLGTVKERKLKPEFYEREKRDENLKHSH